MTKAILELVNNSDPEIIAYNKREMKINQNAATI